MYASQPMIGTSPFFFAVSWNSTAPNMTPWSVRATPGAPSVYAFSHNASTRHAPSSSEYSLWTWRWTNELNEKPTYGEKEARRASTPDVSDPDRYPASLNLIFRSRSSPSRAARRGSRCPAPPDRGARGRARRVRTPERRAVRPAAGVLDDELHARDRRHPGDGPARDPSGAALRARRALRRRRRPGRAAPRDGRGRRDRPESRPRRVARRRAARRDGARRPRSRHRSRRRSGPARHR